MELKNKEIVSLKDSQARALVIEAINSHGFPQPSQMAIRKAVATCKGRYRHFLKNKSKLGNDNLLADFLEKPFRLPEKQERLQLECANKEPPLASSNSKFVNQSKDITIKSLGCEVNTLKKELDDSFTQKVKQQEGSNTILQENATLKRKLKYHEHANSERKKKRKLITGLEQKKKLHCQIQLSRYKKTNKSLQIKIDHMNIKQKENRAQKRRFQLQVTYYKELVNKLNTETKQLPAHHKEDSVKHEETLTKLTEGNRQLEKATLELQSENEWLRSLIDDNQELLTYCEGKYTPETQQCVYDLLSCHVATSQVGNVIKSVLKLAGKTPSHTPCKGTVINMNTQRLILAQKQLSEELPNKGHTCLLSDETTKFDKRIEGMHVSDDDGRVWVLGLREIQTKSAHNVHNTFQEILADIEHQSKATQGETSRIILTNIVARMSDRAATEIKLGELIEETRKEVLPLVHEQFRDMSPDDITAVGKLLVFSCGLHGLVHMAETAGKSLLEAEKGLFGGSIPSAAPQMRSPSESGTVRLVRTACKAFARGGDARSGCHLQFMAHVQPFLNAHKMTTLPLTPFRGNRFNILFANAGHLFFLLQEMVAFLNYSDI